MRALAVLSLFVSLGALAGPVTVIRPKPFIGDQVTYYVMLDGKPVSDLDSRESVRFDVPAGRHALAIRCPKALSRSYLETQLERDFGTGPAFFAVEPKYDCATLHPLDAAAAAPMLANTTLRAPASTYVEGEVGASAAALSETPAPASPQPQAGARQQVASATAAWVEAFNSRDPARIAALYDGDAVLIGADAKAPAVGKPAIAAYFAEARTRPMDRAALGEHQVRVYGDTAIDSGLCNFFAVNAGKATVTPVRYTFVYRKRDGKWLIVQHHASHVP